MKYLSLSIFAVWVFVRLASGQEKLAAETPAEKIVAAAMYRTTQTVHYNPAYVSLKYPGGDVPADTGVCTDVVIRTYRAALGIDLQKLVHEDMKRSFSAYPKNWGLKRPDKNIDHRRVPNLQRFFKRKGAALSFGKDAKYLPGDLIAWDLSGNNLWHIGVVVGEDKFVHNVGSGPVLDSGIKQWKIVGHYRFLPTSAK